MFEEKIKLLLAEDDYHLGLLLSDYLKSEGYLVHLCRDGEEALKSFKKEAFDLCLLDIMMPKMDGFKLTEQIKNIQNNIPIIFITAKSQKADKIIGYQLGADDFITKPFDEEELNYKIKALIKRSARRNEKTTDNIIQLGLYTFDYKNQLLSIHDHVKRLTERECALLLYLSKHRNTVIKREYLLEAIWGENNYFLGRSLDVFITKMRKYLKEDAKLSIENVFGVGFVFNAPEIENV